ncbi:sensor histidine kinase [Streptomyces sp. 8N706]|uniref:sensor histidine kinase n=1 Tax=Streptomyces sp. 8N706 TaxID=3457416 RepID=UPI003FD698CB
MRPPWLRSPAYPYVSGVALVCIAASEVISTRITSATVLATLPVVVVPVVWRHRYPWLGLIVVAAALLNFLFRSELLLSVAVAGIVGMYGLARHRVMHPVLLAAAGVVGSLLVNVGHIALGVYDLGGSAPAIGSDGSLSYFTEAFVVSVAVVATVCSGDAVRSREESRREREAAQRQLIAMERRQAVEAERVAIARELHDIVAHAVSVMAVQAESATYTTPGLSPQARESFQQIAGSARSALTELRHLLNVLRKDANEEASVAPQPTLGSLDDLLETHRSTGGKVELRTEGPRPALSSSVELSVYRIVQEALTNARRHAPGACVVVDLAYRQDRVGLRILDDGPGPAGAANGTGHGLGGMRERATVLGGRLTSGPGPDGGFLIEADLPVQATPSGLADHAGEQRPPRRAPDDAREV